MRRGASFEQAIFRVKGPDSETRKVLGALSLFMYCKEHGLRYHIARRRLMSGDTIQDAIEYAKGSKNESFKDYFKGLSLREYCKLNNYDYSRAYYLITYKNISPNKIHLFFKDKPLSLHMYCNANGYNYKAISRLMREKGLTKEEAIALWKNNR